MITVCKSHPVCCGTALQRVHDDHVSVYTPHGQHGPLIWGVMGCDGMQAVQPPSHMLLRVQAGARGVEADCEEDGNPRYHDACASWVASTYGVKADREEDGWTLRS